MSNVEIVLETCQNFIHKKSIRIQEFFVDFDRLRSGLVHPNQFITALGIAGVDLLLSESDLDSLKHCYTVKTEGYPDMIDYKAFCKSITTKSMWKNSNGNTLKQSLSKRGLSHEEDIRVQELLADISENCRKKDILAIKNPHVAGILVKPMFVDFANSNNSTRLVGHVTKYQFHRTMDVKLGIKIAEEDMKLLCAKYYNPDYDEMVNYIDFSNDIIPDEKPYNPYTEA